MPQDGLRSALYRSLVTCNDPKGVVTCKTIRKSKANCSHKMENRKKQISLRKINNTLSDSMDSPGSEDTAFMATSREEETALHSPASFQLMEVSRGAQKLNRVIECWSRGVPFGARSNHDDIAKDLLRGAIDLQDSLVMLGKLHEASRYMARLKRRHAAEPPSPAEPSGEELKRVIRESLVKQQLVMPPGSGSGSGSGSESLSGRSSQSAARGPSVIAKLMGLEEAAPKVRIDAPPRTRLPRRAAPAAEPERRSLREILETMQFKGLLRSESSDRPSSEDHCPRNAASLFEPRVVDDGQPIVLIKPLRVPCVEPRDKCRLGVEEEDPLYRRKMLRKLRKCEELEPRAITGYRERALKPDRRARKPDEEVAVEEKEIVAKANGSVKSKASRPVRRYEGVEKRAEKVSKAMAVNKKSLDKDVAKSKTGLKREDQAKRVLVKAKKPDSESNTAKKPSAAKLKEQNSACDSTYQRKNYQKKDKPMKKPTPVISIIHEKKIELSGESDYHEVTIDTTEAQLATLEDQLLKDDTEISGSEIEERCGDGQSPLPEDTNLSKTADTKASKTEKASLRALLTSSLSFQNRAEELFDLDTNNPATSPHPSPIDGLGESGAKLLLDCAAELIERKALQDSRPAHSSARARARRCVSLEALVEEACRGIEALRGYGELAGQGRGLAVDCVYAMVERDVAAGGAVDGVWDAGWRAGFSPDDAEQVANDVERMVFCGLVEEVFA